MVYDLCCRNEVNNSPSAETLRGLDSREDVGVLATGHEGGEEFDPRFSSAAHCRALCTRLCVRFEMVLFILGAPRLVVCLLFWQLG